MTTFKELIAEYCSSKSMGMMESDLVNQVVQEAVNEEFRTPRVNLTHPFENTRWGSFDDDLTKFPEFVQSVVLMDINHLILRVIDENCREVSYRYLFQTNQGN